MNWLIIHWPVIALYVGFGLLYRVTSSFPHRDWKDTAMSVFAWPLLFLAEYH